MTGRNYIRISGEVPDQNLRARGIRRPAKREDRRMSHCGGVEGLTGATMGESPTSDSGVEGRTSVTMAAPPTSDAGLCHQDQPPLEYSENETSEEEEETTIMFRNHDITPEQSSAQIWDKYRRDFPRTCRRVAGWQGCLSHLNLSLSSGYHQTSTRYFTPAAKV